MSSSEKRCPGEEIAKDTWRCKARADTDVQRLGVARDWDNRGEVDKEARDLSGKRIGRRNDVPQVIDLCRMIGGAHGNNYSRSRW